MNDFFRIIKKYWNYYELVSKQAMRVYSLWGSIGYALWAYIYLYVNESYQDSFWQRAIVLWPLGFTVGFSNYLKLPDKLVRAMFFYLLLIAVGHFQYLVYLNNADAFYIAGSVITLSAVFFLESAPKGIFAVSTFSLLCILIAAYFNPGMNNFFWFAANATAITFGSLGFYLRLLVIEKLEQSRLRTEEGLRKLTEQTLELEKERSRAAQAEKMAALGVMSAGVAHEINNPLAIIRGFVENIDHAVKDKKHERIEERLHKIRLTVDRIAKIISGLQGFSSTADREAIQNIQLATFVEGVLFNARNHFSPLGVKIIVSQYDGEYRFEGRLLQLEQVLNNLLVNACEAAVKFKKDNQHNQDSQHEQYKEAWVKLNIISNSNHVEFHIIDCGLGIDRDLQQKIFQPFFTTKAVGAGTGLGLSVALGVVQKHKGIIYIDSDNYNTSFVVRIPKTQQIDLQKIYNIA